MADFELLETLLNAAFTELHRLKSLANKEIKKKDRNDWLNEEIKKVRERRRKYMLKKKPL